MPTQPFIDAQGFSIVAAGPPPQATGLSIAGLNVTPTSPAEGSTVTITFDLVCTGQGGAYALSGAFGAPGNNDVVTVSQASGTIQTGQAIPITLTSGPVPYWQNVPVAQTYPHTLTLQLNDFQEAFYTPNAVITLPGVPQPAGAPNVTISAPSCYVLFAATEATDIEVAWEYTNQGNAPATDLEFAVAINTSDGGYYSKSWPGVALLAPGESQPGRAVWNIPKPGISCTGAQVTVMHQ